MKRRPFTLIEVFIAAILASTLVGILFTCLKRQILGSNQFDHIRNEALARAHVQHRLSHIFSTATSPPRLDEKTLEFTFDNGIDADPDYCHKVSAKLSLERDGTLVLLTGKTPRKETLFSHVKNVEFQLLKYDEKSPEMVLMTVWRRDQQVAFALPLSP